MQEYINKQIVQLEPITTLRDKQGFRFYSTNDGKTLYAEKNSKIYNVSEDSLQPIGEVPLAHRRFEFVGIVNDEDIAKLGILYYENQTFGRVRKQFGMAKGGQIEIGDYVKIKETYGGGSGIVEDIMNNFVVVKTKEGKKSYHLSDLIAYSSASEAAYDLGDEDNEDYEDYYAKGGQIALRDAKYTMSLAFDNAGFSKAFKDLKRLSNNVFLLQVSSYIKDNDTLQKIVKEFNETLKSNFVVDKNSFKKTFNGNEIKIENKTSMADGGELESKKQYLLEYLNNFPKNAESWRQATDEVRDIARMARITYLEVDEKEYEPLDFKTLKTPAEWNTLGREYITDMYNRMSDEAKKEFLDAFEHTFQDIKVGDTIRIKEGLGLGSLMNLEGEDLEVKKITRYPFASGIKKFYHVEYDGDKYEVREDFVDNERMEKGGYMAHLGRNENSVTFSIDSQELDEMLHNSFESQLEYVDNIGDVLYKLPKRQFDRLIDMADSRGFDVDYENSEESVIIVYDNYADGGELPTITKEEWNKKQKDSKLKTDDGKYYIMKYDDKIGTYLQEVKVLEDGGELSKSKELKSKIEKILDKVLPGFYKNVFVRKNYFDNGEYIGIIMAASNYEINRVKGQYPQDVSLMLDVNDMDLHVQVFGGNGGNRIYLVPDKNDPKEKYLAMAGVKIPFRTPKKEEKFVLQAIEKFAESYKNALKENKDRLFYKEYVDYDTLIMADGGFVDKSDEELKSMNDDELFAYLDAKAAYMKQYKRPLSAYKAKNFAANATAVQYQKEGTSKLEDNFPDIKKINEQTSRDTSNYLNNKLENGGETTFEDKVKAIQKNLLKNKKVPAIVQKDYGKTYNKAEAKESAQRIVGAQTAKMMEMRNKMSKGGKTSVSPLKDRIIGSKKNKVGTASSKTSAKEIELSETIITALSEKAKEYNNKHSKKVSTSTLKAVMRRGMGAFSSSHRPGMTRQGWGYARVNKFLLKKGGKKVKATYTQDDDLLENGGELKKEMKVSDKPKFKKFIELEEKAKASMYKAKNYSRWNETTGENFRRRWYKMAAKLRGWEGEFIPMGVKSKPEWIKFTEEQGAVEDYNFGDVLA